MGWVGGVFEQGFVLWDLLCWKKYAHELNSDGAISSGNYPPPPPLTHHLVACKFGFEHLNLD